jgi:hypothetical protein
MRYVARHRAPRTTTVRSRTMTVAAAAMAASVALVSAPATSSALDTTPYQQTVLGTVRVVSFVSVPQTSSVTATVVGAESGIQLRFGALTADESEGGDRVPLSRTYPNFHHADANFTHDAQWNETYSKINWGTRLSSTWQSQATSPLTENSYWYVDGSYGGNSHHAGVPADYLFHGTINGVGPGDTVDMATEITFECGPDATCNGTLYASYYIEA